MLPEQVMSPLCLGRISYQLAQRGGEGTRIAAQILEKRGLGYLRSTGYTGIIARCEKP